MADFAEEADAVLAIEVDGDAVILAILSVVHCHMV